MLSDAFPARTNAAMLLMLIATTSSHTCTKPIVVRSYCQTTLFFFLNDWLMVITVGANNSPNVIGKNQNPNPSVTPFVVKYVKRIMKEKISKIVNFKNRNILVAEVYCL